MSKKNNNEFICDVLLPCLGTNIETQMELLLEDKFFILYF